MKPFRTASVLLLTTSLAVAPVVTAVGTSGGAIVPELETLTVDVAPEGGSVVTREMPTEDFSLVGATWQAGTEPPAVQVRTRSEDGSWTRWTELEAMEEGPDDTSAEAADAVAATEPVWVGDSEAVQVKVVTTAAGPDSVDLALVDPGTGGSVASTPVGTADAAGRPSIITRAQWGADESLRSCTPGTVSGISGAVVHHTASSNTYTTAAQAMAQLRAIYAYHTKTLGWCDIGYNFVVDSFGNVYEGRSGSATSSQFVVGAHTSGFNSQTVGVSMLGNFVSTTPPAPMVNAVGRVVGWQLARAGVSPQATTTLTYANSQASTKFAVGQRVTVPTVTGHISLGSTACPGAQGIAALPSIRVIAAGGGVSAPAQTDCPPPVESLEPFTTVGVSARKGNIWYQRTNLSAGVSDGCFAFGNAGDIPLWADFDGDGRQSPVLYRPSNSTWYWTSTTNGTGTVRSFSFGRPGDQPVVGDWNNDGIETPGLFRPSTGQWYLNNTVRGGVADGQFGFGSPGDVAVTGDWNNDGTDTLGLFRPSNGTWYITDALWPGPQSAQRFARFGSAGDQPVVGDWNGDGVDTFGIYRPSSSTFFMTNARANNAGLTSQNTFQFGQVGSVAGVWH